MWTCGLLKRNARQALSGRYWMCTAVCLIAGIFGANSVFANLSSQFQQVTAIWQEFTQPDVWTGNHVDPTLAEILEAMSVTGLLGAIAIGILIGAVIGIVYRTFVSAPLASGLCRYMMESRQGKAPVGTLFGIFRRPYLNVVKVLFLTNLKILLGSIIIIPGIYWAYAYRLVPLSHGGKPLPHHRARHGTQQSDDAGREIPFLPAGTFLHRLGAALSAHPGVGTDFPGGVL